MGTHETESCRVSLRFLGRPLDRAEIERVTGLRASSVTLEGELPPIKSLKPATEDVWLYTVERHDGESVEMQVARLMALIRGKAGVRLVAQQYSGHLWIS